MSIWELSIAASEDAGKLRKFEMQKPLFGGTKKIATLIDRLSVTCEPAAIPFVASGLFSSKSEIHSAASSGIAKLLSLVPSIDLIRLNELLGGYYYGYVSERWNEIKPTYVETHLRKTNDVWVGNLLSLHKNGYVRQTAISFLSSSESKETLPFLLLRQNDWVDPIAKQAEQAVLDRLTHENLDSFVTETDLIFHLLQCRRRDLGTAVSRYVDLLVDPQHGAHLRKAIECCGKKSGRTLIDYLLEREGNHLAETIRWGVASHDGVIRCKCLKRASTILTPAECVEIADPLLVDKYIPVRQEAYELKARSSHTESSAVWIQALFDKSRSVRETAIFFLGKSGQDVADIYREHLTSSPDSLPALAGLVATGDQSDVSVLSSYLTSPFASRRAEAVRGIGRVGSESEILDLQQLLLDESKRVVRMAHQQLLPHSKSIDPELSFGLIGKCRAIAGKVAILRLLFDLGRWPAMSYLIRAAGSPDKPLSDRSKDMIVHAFSLNRVFTQPSSEQRNQIQSAIDEHGKGFEKEFALDLKSYISSYGFKFDAIG